MPSPRRRLAALALVAAAVAALAWASAAPAAPGWTPQHEVSPPGLGGSGPSAALYAGHRDRHLGLAATAAWAVWESGGVIRAAERPATLGAWAPPVAISAGAGAAAPQVARDVAVWQRTAGADTIVQAAVRTDGAWAPPQDLSLPGGAATAPRAAGIGGVSGGTLVAWQRSEGGDALVEVSVRSPTTGEWSPPSALSSPGGEASGVRVAPRGNGAIAVWQRVDGGDSTVQAALLSGLTGTWSAPVDVSPPGQAAADPEMAVTSGSRAVVVWVTGTGAAAAIGSSSLPQASADWTDPVAISPAGASAPALTAGTNAVAAWQRADGPASLLEAAILSADTAAWSAPERLSAAGEDAEEPALATGGVLIAAWRRPTADGAAVQAATRPLGVGAWSAPQEIAPPGAAVGGLRVEVGNDEALAVWSRGAGPDGAVQASAYDTLGPLYTDLSVEPSPPRVGQPAELAIAAFDTWSPVVGIDWSFGDGGTASGARVDHVYQRELPFPRLPFRITVDLTDALGHVTAVTGHEARPVAPPAPPAPPATGQPVCAEPSAPTTRESGGRVAQTRGQLLVNQRIAQAAVRRASAIEAWLAAGIEGRDLCGGAFGAGAFGDGVEVAGGISPAAPGPPDPRPLDPGPAADGAPAAVTLSARQLLVNQRISQAAVRRVNALAARLDAGLSGGDLRDGAVAADKLAPGLAIVRATPPVTLPGPTATRVAAPSEGGARRVTLSARQIRINQRIAQAAVRRANALRLRLQRGLTQADFQPRTITAAKLGPSLRGA